MVVIEEEVVREDLTVAAVNANLMAAAAVSANHMEAENANRMAAAAVAANADLTVVAKAEAQIAEVAKAGAILQKEDRRVQEAQAVLILLAVLQEENAKTKIQEAADGNPFALIIEEQV